MDLLKIIIKSRENSGSGSLTVVKFLYIYHRHLSTIFITKTGDVLKLYVRTGGCGQKTRESHAELVSSSPMVEDLRK